MQHVIVTGTTIQIKVNTRPLWYSGPVYYHWISNVYAASATGHELLMGTEEEHSSFVHPIDLEEPTWRSKVYAPEIDLVTWYQKECKINSRHGRQFRLWKGQGTKMISWNL